MIVTNKIKMDLTNRSLTPTVDVMQDDQMSRNLEISLYSGFEAFVLPENCVALVRYKKRMATAAFMMHCPTAHLPGASTKM